MPIHYVNCLSAFSPELAVPVAVPVAEVQFEASELNFSELQKSSVHSLQSILDKSSRSNLDGAPV